MTNEVATMSDEWTPGKIDLLRRTICKGATDDEMALFIGQCRRLGLDPLSRQCHAVKRWDSKEKREVMTIQVGIDGLRLIADRTGKYAGNDEPIYDSEDGEHPNKATCTVWKLVAGVRQPFTRSARWSEFVQTTSQGAVTRFWAKMPFLMLGKVAEALAIRAAFPQELSGLYTDDEMGQAESTAAVVVHPPKPVQPQAALPAGGQQQSPKTDDDLKPGAVYMMLAKTIAAVATRIDLYRVRELCRENRAKMSRPEQRLVSDQIKLAEQDLADAEAESAHTRTDLTGADGNLPD